jgi:hypothetical protein
VRQRETIVVSKRIRERDVAVASLLTLRYLAAERSVLCRMSCAIELRGYELLLLDTSVANARPS